MSGYKFIYVFTAEARDKLVSLGFNLLKQDTVNDVYIFENQEIDGADLGGITMVKTDTLSF